MAGAGGRAMKRYAGQTYGQAMVELALLLPVLLALLVAVLDFGFLLHAHVQVAHAAREAARAGSLYPVSANAACWTLRDWVENALVERNRDAGGCPLAGSDTSVHAFGSLLPTPCAVPAVAPCWELQPLATINDLDVRTVISGTAMPEAGDQLEVQVLYRYNMPFVGNLPGLPINPVTIRKTVLMKVQNS